MLSDIINARVIKISENIFNYRLDSLVNDLYSVMESLNNEMAADMEISRKSINNIFKAIVSALEHKDYLLISDILLYELLPCIELSTNNMITIQQ